MMEEKRMAQLDPRLERVADFVRPGALFADVGCDHGHLSVELMRRGAQRGFACDIKEGPLQAAKRNLEKAGFAFSHASKFDIIVALPSGCRRCGPMDLPVWSKAE